MSVLTYGTTNPVTLPYCYITDFRQEAVTDDVSQTDWIYTKIDLQAQSVLNADYLNLIAPDLAGQTRNPADIMSVIRSRLLKPRQKLQFTFNGIDLIPKIQDGLPGTVDAKNGPIPQSCVVKQMTNVTFLFTYHIIAHYWENTDIEGGIAYRKNQPGNNVLSNRWTETVDLDKDMMTLRTRQGKFIIRSDNLSAFIADQARSQFAVVGVPIGFTRLSSKYTVTPDGLGVSYTVVDKEAFKLPPRPAFTAKGQYIESGTFKLQAFRTAECWVRLTGSKDTDQALLLQTAIAVANSKVRSNRRRQLAINVPESTSIMVDLYENIVECRVRALTKPHSTANGTGTIEGLWGFDAEAAVATPYSDYEVQPPTYLDRGSAGLLLQAAAYYDPSLRGNQLNQATGQTVKGTAVGTAGAVSEDSSDTPAGGPFSRDNPITLTQLVVPPNVLVGPLEAGPDDADYEDLSTPTGIFTDYKVVNRFESDKHRYMMPVTHPDGFAGQSVAFVQLASPTLLWIADWTAAKLDEPPEIPNIDVQDDDWVLLDEHYEPYMISVAADGITPLYRQSGVFVYGAKNPSDLALLDIIYPKAPWVPEGVVTRIQSVDTLFQGVINQEGEGG